MNLFRNILLTAMVACISSCMLMHDDQAIARVGKNVLYKSQMEKHIPAGLPTEDSLAMVQKYINNWASTLIMDEMSRTQLSKEELDISRELEDFRSSLIKYRYEQHYITDRLDTVVTKQQISDFYSKDSTLFTLSIPIAKARYMRIQEASPMKEKLLKLMDSEDEDELYLLDSLAGISADKFLRFDKQWIDLVTIAHEYGTDYGTLIASINNRYIRIVDEQGFEHITYLFAYIPSGKVPPIEYCEDRIRDVIVSRRKYILSSNLERDLLENAQKKGNFEIY